MLRLTASQSIDAEAMLVKIDLAAHQTMCPVECDIKGVSQEFDASVIIRAPDGFRAKTSESPAQKWNHRFVRGELNAVAEKTGWRLDYRLHQPAGRFAAADYAGFCAIMDRVSSELSPKLTFEPIRP